MTRDRKFLQWLGLALAAFLFSALPSFAANRITILYDAFGKQAALQQDWGYAALIEFDGKRILFDSGGNIALFRSNVEHIHVDLTHLDMVIMTHAHGDHTSGLRYVLSQNPGVPIYVPDDPYFTGNTLPDSFLATDARPDLPADMRYFRGGKRPQAKGWLAWSDAKMIPVSEAITIVPKIHLVALVSDKPAFKGLREISLVLDTPQGPVVVVGCSHPGIEKIMAEATAADPAKPVYMLFGGLHLLQDSQEQITSTLSTLSDQYHVRKMAIGHCTGELAFELIQQRWKANALYAGLGEAIPF